MQMAMQMKMQMEMQMGMGPAPSSEWVGGCGHGRGRRGHGRGTWDLGTLGLGGGGTREHGHGRVGGRTRRTSTRPGSNRLFRLPTTGSERTGTVLSHSPTLPLYFPGPRSGSRARAPGQGTAATHTKYNRDTCRSRWRRGILPSTAPDHISQMTAPPSQPATSCWGPARLSRLVLPRRCWCTCWAQVLYRAATVVSSSFWALTGSSMYPSIHPPIHSSVRATVGHTVLTVSIQLSGRSVARRSACASTLQLQWDRRRVRSAECKVHEPRTMLALSYVLPTLCHLS